jgi:hypothetical protein
MGQPVVHFEVQGSDREALTRFYQQLFGWKTTDVSEMNYTMVETGGEGGINGGIGTTPEGAPGGSRSTSTRTTSSAHWGAFRNLAAARSGDRWTCPTVTNGRCSQIPKVTWSACTAGVSKIGRPSDRERPGIGGNGDHGAPPAR